jgi:hypothetical protein
VDITGSVTFPMADSGINCFDPSGTCDGLPKESPTDALRKPCFPLLNYTET